MEEPDSDPDFDEEQYQKELKDAVDDGGGCAEMWETLSEQRTIRSESTRRGFISRIAITLGVLPTGASAVVSASSKGSQSTDQDSSDGEKDGPIEVEEVHGKKRQELIQAAKQSEKVRYAAEQLGKRGNVKSVYQYTLPDDTTGYSVVFGIGDANNGTTIRYYESEIFEDGTSVVGGKPSGDGLVIVNANDKNVVHVNNTSLLEDSMKLIQQNKEYKEFKRELDEATLVEHEAILVHDPATEGGQAWTEIVVPIQENDKITDRVVVAGPDLPSSSNIQEYSIISPSGDGVTTQQVEFDACAALCAVLVAAGSVGCISACLAFPATIALAPYCGTLCGAVITGTCVPTCENIFGDDDNDN